MNNGCHFIAEHACEQKVSKIFEDRAQMSSKKHDMGRSTAGLDAYCISVFIIYIVAPRHTNNLVDLWTDHICL